MLVERAMMTLSTPMRIAISNESPSYVRHWSSKLSKTGYSMPMKIASKHTVATIVQLWKSTG
jgi:hypothetical protein